MEEFRFVAQCQSVKHHANKCVYVCVCVCMCVCVCDMILPFCEQGLKGK